MSVSMIALKMPKVRPRYSFKFCSSESHLLGSCAAHLVCSKGLFLIDLEFLLFFHFCCIVNYPSERGVDILTTPVFDPDVIILVENLDKGR